MEKKEKNIKKKETRYTYHTPRSNIVESLITKGVQDKLPFIYIFLYNKPTRVGLSQYHTIVQNAILIVV